MNRATYFNALDQLNDWSNGLDDGGWNDRYVAKMDALGLKIVIEQHDFLQMMPLPAPNSKNPYPYPSWIGWKE